MARIKKIGLEYFPVDIDMFQDIRIRKLIKRKGGGAVALYTSLLCMIYKEGYYITWDEDLPFILSEQTGFDESYIQDVFNYCLELGLFDAELFKSDKIITSRGIQKRYKLICETCRRAYNIDKYNLISVQETPISAQETPISVQETPNNCTIGTQSKVKESKGKEKESITPPLTPPHGGVSESGGGALSLIFSQEGFVIRDVLGKAGVPDNEAWSFLRITMTSPELKADYARKCVNGWAKEKAIPFYQLLQRYERLEESGRIHPLPHDDFIVHRFVHCNLMGSDKDSILRMIESPQFFNECKRLVAEIMRPGSNINQPGKFIIAGLRKLQSTINHKTIK